MVNGLEVNFLSEPVQYKVPKSMNMLKEEKMLMEQEIPGLLRKGITRTNHCQNKFVSKLFLGKKKDGR